MNRSFMRVGKSIMDNDQQLYDTPVKMERKKEKDKILQKL